MEPEEDDDLLSLSATPLSSSPPPPPRQRRPICPNCSRPSPVCLCHALPAQPIPTKTQIIILHHPHEAQHKLSTTPILTKCLSNATAVVGRRLRHGLCPLLDQSPHTIYLFPSTPNSSPAVTLSHLRHLPPPSLLIAFDATWKHAKEMVRASEDFLSGFAKRVCLDFDESVSGGSIYDSDLVLRKEPFGGCVTTMEAVARTLGVVEPNGPQIEDRLVGILREMVRLQAGFLKPIKPRPKLVKKKFNKGQKNGKNVVVEDDDDDDIEVAIDESESS